MLFAKNYHKQPVLVETIQLAKFGAFYWDTVYWNEEDLTTRCSGELIIFSTILT